MEETEVATGVTALFEAIETYTDKHMIFTSWEWNLRDVAPGESAGFCMRPLNWEGEILIEKPKPVEREEGEEGEEAPVEEVEPEEPVDTEPYATCWYFKMNEDEKMEGPISLLIPPSMLGPESRLEDMDPTSQFPVPALYGNWFCTPAEPAEGSDTVRVTCGRFNPVANVHKDPEYTDESEIEALTYLTGRLTGRLRGGSKSGVSSERTAFKAFEFDVGVEMIMYALDEGSQAITALGSMALAIASFAF